ncbi:ScyD/ScyE family protein [Dyadobacter frigoris]|uniref:ScyD/ScyE family protein n=1 Tax=Dyadobacter frigoris TaxID=2576211 RepID=A0A4U6D8C8_9BACT|nr:ScyD/ScyE family protein [Dyadobacter frigoris]TKT92591.1 ScyD/ScyE family protein [Dyadobacter frigoris]GLU51476.1 hypothetical protein Dfri01_09370 [Dyadobacter frigoris]
MKTTFLSKLALVPLLLAWGCTDHNIFEEPKQFKSEDLAGQLLTPFAITKGANDYFWITEIGTGKDDGRVSLITPDGKVYPVIVGFKSSISEEEGLPDGLTHLTYKDGILYIIHGGEGFLYKANVSAFKPGDKPMQASSLPSENISQFVLKYDFLVDTQESHLYNLTWGPDGDLFFTDAAANAIIRRKSNGDLSIFSQFAPFANPGPVGPPMIDVVPTGIVYDGYKFLVSTLSGFPFIEGKAAIYQIDQAGTPGIYKGGFTTLTDITLTPSGKPVVIQFAKFALPDGFLPNTGKVSDENGLTLLDGLMMPTDIERTGDKTYYVVSMALGKIIKLTY